MQTNVFPQTYNYKIDEKMRNEQNNAQQRKYNRVQSINNMHTSAPEGNGMGWGYWIGIFGGFIACVCVCINNSADAGFVTWIVTVVVSVIIGMLIDKRVKVLYENNESNIARRIAEEEKSLEEELKEIAKKAQKDKDNYYKEFESNAQNMSVQFAESELAKEVIEWMTDGFCRNIDSADRRSHIEQIRVPFVFNIFDNKITCNLGTFDFELKRCRNLNSPLEQTALARVIVSAIQLNIMMKYPKDASGTSISIEITYSYTNEYPVTTITYVAPNGNYKAVKEW